MQLILFSYILLGDFVGDFVFSLIENFGYFGMFLGMVLEAVIIIIPSEAVLATGGILASQGVFSFCCRRFYAPALPRRIPAGSAPAHPLGSGGSVKIRGWLHAALLHPE